MAKPMFIYVGACDSATDAEADCDAIKRLNDSGAIGSAIIVKQVDGGVRVTKTEKACGARRLGRPGRRRDSEMAFACNPSVQVRSGRDLHAHGVRSRDSRGNALWMPTRLDPSGDSPRGGGARPVGVLAQAESDERVDQRREYRRPHQRAAVDDLMCPPACATVVIATTSGNAVAEKNASAARSRASRTPR